jgi:hypothetical protein
VEPSFQSMRYSLQYFQGKNVHCFRVPKCWMLAYYFDSSLWGHYAKRLTGEREVVEGASCGEAMWAPFHPVVEPQ